MKEIPRMPIFYHRWWLKRLLRNIWQMAVQHPLEYMIFQSFIWIGKRAGLDRASMIGARLGQIAGHIISKRTKVGRTNLAHALPNLSVAERERILWACWEHFGRNAMEYSCLNQLRFCCASPRTKIIGIDYLEKLRETGGPALIFTGHIGHWELVTWVLHSYGIGPLYGVYRQPNNRYIDRSLVKLQSGSTEITVIQKGSLGARQIIRALKQKGIVIMLMDQKMNDGIPIPFFGRDAMTAPAIINLAIRFNAPVIPIRTERLGESVFFPPRIETSDSPNSAPWGAWFHAQIYPPRYYSFKSNQSNQETVKQGLLEINALLESWVRQKPEQWLWLHQRWPK